MIKLFNDFIIENYTSALLDSIPARKITFTKLAFDQYNEWLTIDRKRHKVLGKLIEQTARDPFNGSKAEPLSRSSGKWSKRIDEKNRLIYLVTKESIEITSCLGHYEDH